MSILKSSLQFKRMFYLPSSILRFKWGIISELSKSDWSMSVWFRLWSWCVRFSSIELCKLNTKSNLHLTYLLNPKINLKDDWTTSRDYRVRLCFEVDGFSAPQWGPPLQETSSTTYKYHITWDSMLNLKQSDYGEWKTKKTLWLVLS